MRIVLLTILLLTGYTRPDVIRTDLTQNEGVYVLAYSTNGEIRRAMEDQLVADLNERAMVAYASYRDLPDIASATRDGVLAAANARRTVAVIVINQVVPGEDGVIDNPLRVSPLHPDLSCPVHESSTAVAHRPMKSYVEYARLGKVSVPFELNMPRYGC